MHACVMSMCIVSIVTLPKLLHTGKVLTQLATRGWPAVGGDFTDGTGTGGESIYGLKFPVSLARRCQQLSALHQKHVLLLCLCGGRSFGKVAIQPCMYCLIHVCILWHVHIYQQEGQHRCTTCCHRFSPPCNACTGLLRLVD